MFGKRVNWIFIWISIYACTSGGQLNDALANMQVSSSHALPESQDTPPNKDKKHYKRATIINNTDITKYDAMEEDIAAVFSKVAFDGVGLHTGYIPRRPLVPVVALTVVPPTPTNVTPPSTTPSLVTTTEAVSTQRIYINSPKVVENDPIEEIRRRYTPRPYLPLTPFPDLNWFSKDTHPPPPVFNPADIFGTRKNNKQGGSDGESSQEEKNKEVSEASQDNSEALVEIVIESTESNTEKEVTESFQDIAPPTMTAVSAPNVSSVESVLIENATANPFSLSDISTSPLTPNTTPSVTTEKQKSFQLSFPIIRKINQTSETKNQEGLSELLQGEIDYDKVLKKYGVAWPAHVYFVGTMFLVLTVLSIICTCLFRSSVKIMTSRYFSVFHILIFLMAFSRTVSFFTDPYNITNIYPKAFGNIMFNISFPCLTSALGITVLALYRTSEIRPWGTTQKSLSLLWLLIVIQFLVIMCAEIVSGFVPSIRLVSLFCPVITILWLIVLSCAYFYIFSKTVKKKTWKEPQANGKAQERLQKMGFVFKTGKISSLTLGFNIVLWVCVLAVTLAIVMIFGLSGLFEIKTNSDPFPWWIYQFCVRVLELFMAYMLVFVSCLKVDKTALDRNGDKVAQVYSIITCSNYCNGHTLFCGNKLTNNTEKENVYTLNPDNSQAVVPTDIYYSQAINSPEGDPQMMYEKITSSYCENPGSQKFEARQCQSCSAPREIMLSSSLNNRTNNCVDPQSFLQRVIMPSIKRVSPVESQDYEMKEESDSTCTYEAISETSLKITTNGRGQNDCGYPSNFSDSHRSGPQQGEVRKLMAGELSLTDSMCFYPTSKHHQPPQSRDKNMLHVCNIMQQPRSSGRFVPNQSVPFHSIEPPSHRTCNEYPLCYTNRVHVDDSGQLSELKRSPKAVDSNPQSSNCAVPVYPQERTKPEFHHPRRTPL